MLGLIMLNLTACSNEPLGIDCHGIYYDGTFTGHVTNKGIENYGGYDNGKTASSHNFWIELDNKIKVYVKLEDYDSEYTSYLELTTITAMPPRYICD